MSTVGVDIGDWTFEKKGSASSGGSGGSGSNGPLVFRTWDFGGQTEYYATHQVCPLTNHFLRFTKVGTLFQNSLKTFAL